MKILTFCFALFFTCSLTAQETSPRLPPKEGGKGVSPIPNTLTPNTRSQTFAVVVGISDYQDGGIPDLRFADKDALAFAGFLQSSAGGELDNDHLKVLTNQNATAGKIAAALYWLIDECREGDRAFIYFSGHGDVERKLLGQPGHLLCWDAPSSVYMAGGTLGLNNFQIVISTLSVENRAKVFVITDACRSGKLSGSEIGGSKLTNANLAQQYANEVKILSCQPHEYSVEGGQWGGGRGAFSYHLIDGLYGLADRDGDGSVSLSEIGRYLEDHVTAEVAPHSQVPLTVGNRGEPLAAVYPEILKEVQNSKAGQVQLFEATESRGIEEEVFSLADSTIEQQYLAFQKALEDRVFLDPPDACAEAYFTVLIREPALAKLHNSMRRNYAAALQDEAQQAINKRLKSDETECAVNSETILKRYSRFPAYLARACELLGEGHYMYPLLQARRNWFTGFLMQNGSDEWNRGGYSALAEIGQYREALAWQKDMPQALLSMAFTFGYKLDEPDSAEHYYARTLEQNPKWLIAIQHFSDFYSLKRADFARARQLIDRAMEIDSLSSYPWLMMGWWYYDTKGDFEEGERYFLKAIELAPVPCHIYALKEFYTLYGQPEKIVQVFEKALAKDPTELGLYYAIVHEYVTQQNWQKGIEVLEGLLQQYPENIWGLRNMGITYVYTGKYDLAKSYLDSALAVAPNDQASLYAKADLNILKKDYAVAEKHLKTALDPARAKNRESRRILRITSSLALIYHYTGREKEAADIMEEAWAAADKPQHEDFFGAHNYQTENPDMYENLANIYWLAHRAVPTNARIPVEQAHLAVLQGNLSDALGFLETGLKNGYDDYQYLKEEQWLVPVRAEKARWEGLMEEYFPDRFKK